MEIGGEYRQESRIYRHCNTISLKCLCIECVNQVKKLAWSGTRSLVSAHSRRGKGISIALVIHSFDPRLRSK